MWIEFLKVSFFFYPDKTFAFTVASARVFTT